MATMTGGEAMTMMNGMSTDHLAAPDYTNPKIWSLAESYKDTTSEATRAKCAVALTELGVDPNKIGELPTYSEIFDKLQPIKWNRKA